MASGWLLNISEDISRGGMISREEVRHALTGPVMSLCTPFTAEDEIDFRGVASILDFAIEGGSKTIILTYGDSLYSVLTEEEIAELVRFVVEHTNGRAMVVAASGFWHTRKVTEFVEYSRTVGADLLMVRPPDWAHSCSVDSIVEYFSGISRHMPLMLVTNFLGAEFSGAGRPHYLEVLRRLKDEVDGIYAVKDDLGGDFLRRMCLTVHDTWAVMVSGTKREVVSAVPFGCDGYMSVSILFNPSIARSFWQAVENNDNPTIRRICTEFDIPFNDFATQYGCANGDNVIHGLLEIKGLAGRWKRKPYASLTDEEMAEVADYFRERGWL